ncbi:transposase domain-containing protein [Paraglaciecola psychrophila]|uniref:Transposase IS66 n=1 Tax=Paraglaciecola psychrophila 170 TaxID=1129794 RepID=K7A7V8_9ALTE|nr:transposase domain-containing protein [Paraglaciecola psychrophila]AGH46378.1 transposase IS66 [Paraglaciecola psychrophila 170]GAC38387.1 conserved hypothetical ISPpu15, transposase [Paraglaciecola psychrophila 170]
MGRKALLLSQTANGTNASATIYSIIETAKANGLVPYYCLMHVMNQITAGNTHSEKLLTWNFNLS